MRIKTAIIVLFCFLTFLGIAGFLVSLADNIIPLGRILSSRHHAASQCFNKLDQTDQAFPSDEGFEELSSILLELLRETYGNGIPANAEIRRITVSRGSSLELTAKGRRRVEDPTRVELADQTTLEIGLQAIRKKIEISGKSTFLIWTACIFGAMTLLQILQFVLSGKESARTKRICEL